MKELPPPQHSDRFNTDRRHMTVRMTAKPISLKDPFIHPSDTVMPLSTQALDASAMHGMPISRTVKPAVASAQTLTNGL